MATQFARQTVPFALQCGPIDVVVDSADSLVASLAKQHLSLFGRPWPRPSRRVHVRIERGRSDLRSCGNYVQCGRMDVEVQGDAYVVTTASGMSAYGITSSDVDRWRVTIPPQAAFDEAEVVDFEYLMLLTCTIGWRKAGWISVHAGAVRHADRCAILCAPSGGGKSTLTAALLSRGWHALGDDKLLLRCDSSGASLAGLMQTFNLHPRTAEWFATFGDIDAQPRYSPWTEKRRVVIGEIGAASSAAFAKPTHIVALSRNASLTGVRAVPLARSEILPTLLRQIVIPSQRAAAREIVSVAERTAREARGFLFEVGDGAYADESWYDVFHEALET